MDENSLSGWGGMSGSNPYSTDNSALASQQSSGNILAGASTGYADPPIQSQVQMPSYAEPSALNGYPMFSSPTTAGLSSPAGYSNANPIDATPSVVMPQARMGGAQMPMPQNPSMPTSATMNPWAIKQSSTSGAMDYPLGQNVAQPKLNVL
jgi:hypothetical protein